MFSDSYTQIISWTFDAHYTVYSAYSTVCTRTPDLTECQANLLVNVHAKNVSARRVLVRNLRCKGYDGNGNVIWEETANPQGTRTTKHYEELGTVTRFASAPGLDPGDIVEFNFAFLNHVFQDLKCYLTTLQD